MLLESSIQRSVVNYAKKYGLLCKKLSVQGPMGNTGWPDFMFLGQSLNDGALGVPIIFFIEFKRPGGKLTPLQEEIRLRIVKLGFKYMVCSDPVEGKQFIKHMMGL